MSKLPPAGLPPYEVACMPVFKEGSLNSSMPVITIIVDDIHFRFDSYFLQNESESLKAIIATSEPDSIRLQNVTAAEVRALWRFFYEGMYDDYKPSNAEWMDLLSIANTYGLKRVHRRALAEIEDIDVNIDPVEQVLLAKKLNVKKWLVPAFVTLCTRTEPIKGTEVDKLGINTFVTLVTARESISRDLFTMKLEDRALLVNDKLRCCGYSPTQLHDGDNGAKICPGCQQIVIPGPGIQPAFTNDNRRCCGYQPSRWMELGNGAWLCSGCQDIVLPQLFSSNLQCCKMPFIDSSRFSQGDNGAYLCAECEKIAIPGPGGADFDNRHLRCCYNPPSKWISQPDGSQICPSCKGITLPCSLTFQERTLALVKRVFDLED